MQTSTEAADLATLAEKAGTQFILALFVDLDGKPCAKLVPVEAVDMLATEGVGFAGYAVGAMGQEPKDPDLMAMPDPASFTPIPFIKDGQIIYDDYQSTRLNAREVIDSSCEVGARIAKRLGLDTQPRWPLRRDN